MATNNSKPPSKPKLTVVGNGGGAPPSNPNHMSVLELSRRVGRHRDTVIGWLGRKSNPCPYVVRADKKSGVDWVLDLPSVIWWLVDDAKSAAEEDSRDDLGDGLPDDAKDRVRLAMLQLQLEEKQKALVRQAYAVMTMERAFGLVRQAVKGIPARFMDVITGMTTEQKQEVHAELHALCVDAMLDAEKELREFNAATTAKG